MSFLLIDDLRVGVIIVETARFRGEGTPLMVMARLKRLPNLRGKKLHDMKKRLDKTVSIKLIAMELSDKPFLAYIDVGQHTVGQP